MYLRAVHADATIRELRQLIHDNPLGILTTAIPSASFPLLQSTHIPFIHDIQDPSSETELGVLRGHLARANPHSKAMMESLARRPGVHVLEQEVMVLFQHPVNHYVTPKFYTETKPATGKVVPTWNYAAAQIYGRARIYCDAKSAATDEFLAKQIGDLSRFAERDIMGYTGAEAGRPGPWEVGDAPGSYIELLRKSIIGIEITVDRLEGKFKMSQELKDGDREGVVKGFEALGSFTGGSMAEIVEERGRRKNACQTS